MKNKTNRRTLTSVIPCICILLAGISNNFAYASPSGGASPAPTKTEVSTCDPAAYDCPTAIPASPTPTNIPTCDEGAYCVSPTPTIIPTCDEGAYCPSPTPTIVPVCDEGAYCITPNPTPTPPKGGDLCAATCSVVCQYNSPSACNSCIKDCLKNLNKDRNDCCPDGLGNAFLCGDGSGQDFNARCNDVTSNPGACSPPPQGCDARCGDLQSLCELGGYKNDSSATTPKPKNSIIGGSPAALSTVESQIKSAEASVMSAKKNLSKVTKAGSKAANKTVANKAIKAAANKVTTANSVLKALKAQLSSIKHGAKKSAKALGSGKY